MAVLALSWARPFVAAAFAVVICSCETSSLNPDPLKNPFAEAKGLHGKTYSIFYTPNAHVEELLASGKIADAAAVWDHQADYFKGSTSERTLNDTRELATKLLAMEAPKVSTADDTIKAVPWPTSIDRWSAVKQTIAAADDTANRVRNYAVLKQSEASGSLPSLSSLEADIAALKRTISATAIDEFRKYPLDRSPGFFDAYPVAVQRSVVLSAARPDWSNALASRSPDDIKRFAREYGGGLDGSSQDEIGRLFYSAVLKNDPEKGFPAILHARQATIEANLNVPSAATIRVIGLNDCPGGVSDFVAKVQPDIGLAAESLGCTQAPTSSALGKDGVAILFFVDQAQVSRKIANVERIQSQYQSGTNLVPNPEFSAARARVTQAQIDQVNVQRQANYSASRCYGNGCIAIGIANGIAIAAAESNVNAAIENLRNTPSALSVPVYSPYEFSRSTIAVSRIARVHYVVMDNQTQTSRQGTVTQKDSREFRINRNLHAEDRDRLSNAAGTSTEAEISAYEKSEKTILLSQIIADALTAKATKGTAVVDLGRDVPKVRATRTERIRYGITDTTQRFDSVVVVENDVGLGSGFFVANNLVLTNYHVISKSGAISVKLYGGGQADGRVVAQDIRLDLALVRVSADGIPVTFYTDRNLPVGQTVEAIGHPRGLKFSITRGVISGLRLLPSLDAPTEKPVQYIQTDAAINPGNSGGPLFLNGKVIGINTWRLSKDDNLGFAVHYGEILDFLRENGVD